ncbi:hypothetical protein [Novosphingobium sp.]|jgi:hypothetical protein|uniref:hypothetical protein n=1 Tax=Novosphingobium sp. TaxID=1874826 RepID=UPI002FE20330
MTLTVITTESGDRLAKLNSFVDGEWHQDGFKKESLFNVFDDETPADLAELSSILTVLEEFPEACIIRGKRTPGTPAEGILRRQHERADEYFGTSEATFEDQPVHWVLIDVDKLAADPDLTMAERHALMISTLPEPFRGADYHYQWSSSAEIFGWEKLSCHLWFWLDQAVTTADLRARAKAEGWKHQSVDIGVLTVVQPHYTAAPVFEGAEDPLAGQRSGLVTLKRRSVVLPPWSPPAPVEHRPEPRSRPFRELTADQQGRIERWVAAVVNGRCQAIVDAPNGEQNAAIYASAAKLGQLVAGGILDEYDARNALATAAREGRHPRDRAESTIRSGMMRGRSSPIYGPPEQR